MDPAPIGVFDSGVGGLTVLRELRCRLPGESTVYLGDTARLPYGTKSPETIARYVLQAADVLAARGVKMLVIACNTATAHALDAVRRVLAPLPVVGVIDPGARAAAEASRSGRIAVIATETTARSGAYEAAIARHRPGARVVSIACPLLVALAEEGWTDGPVAEGAVARYLEPLHDFRPDTLVLGCTHFPLLAAPIQRVVGDRVRLIDSGKAAAEEVESQLRAMRLLAPLGNTPDLRFLATDSPERFARVAAQFMGFPIPPSMVEVVDFAAGQERARVRARMAVV